MVIMPLSYQAQFPDKITKEATDTCPDKPDDSFESGANKYACNITNSDRMDIEECLIFLYKCTFNNMNFSNKGSAIYVSNSQNSLLKKKNQIIRCKFTNCNSGNDGGAIFYTSRNIETVLYISECEFYLNNCAGSGSDGGALYFVGPTLFIDHSIFINNTAGFNGDSLSISHHHDNMQPDIKMIQLTNNIFEQSKQGNNELIYLTSGDMFSLTFKKNKFLISGQPSNYYIFTPITNNFNSSFSDNCFIDNVNHGIIASSSNIRKLEIDTDNDFGVCVDPTPSQYFSNSNKFSMSFFFTLSEKFSGSNKFSQTKHFSETDKFSQSSFFSSSIKFAPTDKFSQSSFFSSSIKFAPTDKFSQSNYFSNTGKFSKTNDFSQSSFFSNSREFLPTNQFSESTTFSETFYFSSSKIFSDTDPFEQSLQFSSSKKFSNSIQFSQTNDFSPSLELIPNDPKCQVLVDDNIFLLKKCYFSIYNEKLVYVYVLASYFSKYEQQEDGSAIYLINCGIHCNSTYFTDCVSSSGGGAIYINNSFEITNNATFIDDVFLRCKASYGGAVFICATSNLFDMPF